MPASADTNKKDLKEACTAVIEKSGSKVHKIEEEPIAFGLVAFNFIFLRDEAKGDTEDLEKELKDLDLVLGAETIDVRRALG